MAERKKHGGVRPNSGRKSRKEELSMIEKLTPMEESAMKALAAGIKAGEFQFIKLWIEYMYGKPQEKVQLSGSVDTKIVFALDERFRDTD
jgi:hypothetical protein